MENAPLVDDKSVQLVGGDETPTEPPVPTRPPVHYNVRFHTDMHDEIAGTPVAARVEFFVTGLPEHDLAVFITYAFVQGYVIDSVECMEFKL